MFPDLSCELVDVADQLADVCQVELFQVIMDVAGELVGVLGEEGLVYEFFCYFYGLLGCVEPLNVLLELVHTFLLSLYLLSLLPRHLLLGLLQVLQQSHENLKAQPSRIGIFRWRYGNSLRQRNANVNLP